MSKIIQTREGLLSGGIRVNPKKGSLKRKKLFGVAVRYRKGSLGKLTALYVSNLKRSS